MRSPKKIRALALLRPQSGACHRKRRAVGPCGGPAGEQSWQVRVGRVVRGSAGGPGPHVPPIPWCPERDLCRTDSPGDRLWGTGPSCRWRPEESAPIGHQCWKGAVGVEDGCLLSRAFPWGTRLCRALPSACGPCHGRRAEEEAASCRKGALTLVLPTSGFVRQKSSLCVDVTTVGRCCGGMPEPGGPEEGSLRPWAAAPLGEAL